MERLGEANLVRLLRKVVDDLSGQSHGHLSRLVAVARALDIGRAKDKNRSFRMTY
jgi:hypothetical protein